jgi:hypothetical protein
VSWWPGDYNTNDVFSGYDGKPAGGFSFVPGEVGEAFSFDGVDGRVEVDDRDGSGLDIPGPLTLDAWINLNAAGSGQTGYIVIKDSETGCFARAMGLQQSALPKRTAMRARC